MLKALSFVALVQAASAFLVFGNNKEIRNGELLPSRSDKTRFPNTCVGDTSTYSFLVQNTGTGSLQLTTDSSNDVFTVSISPPSLNPGQYGNLKVQYSPLSDGQDYAEISMGEFLFGVAGAGMSSGVEVQWASGELLDHPTTMVDFGSHPDSSDYGDTAQLVIKNTGLCDATVLSAKILNNERDGVLLAESVLFYEKGFTTSKVNQKKLSPGSEIKMTLIFNYNMMGDFNANAVVTVRNAEDIVVPAMVTVGSPYVPPVVDPNADPNAVCVDKLDASGDEWFELPGQYGCEYYGTDPAELCPAYGDYAGYNGLTGNTACCVCADYLGGPPPAPEPPVVVVPADCVDKADPVGGVWSEIEGDYGCDWFALNALNYCSDFGDNVGYIGLTANEVCCVCGAYDGDTPSPVEPTCTDMTDVFGGVWYEDAEKSYGCDWYALGSLDDLEFNCGEYGNNVGANGGTAKEVCCDCAPYAVVPTVPTDSSCVDKLDAVTGLKWTEDVDVYDCAWYENSANTESDCGEYGGLKNANGFSAQDNCCACAPYVLPDCDDKTLTDGGDWADDITLDYGCWWYAEEPETRCSNGYEFGGLTAATACCACQPGGVF